jgi:hypothetical protein
VPGVVSRNGGPHRPVASVVQVRGPAGLGAAPPDAASAIVTGSPAAGAHAPVPAFRSRVTVNVCEPSQWRRSVSAIAIRASTHVAAAGAEFAPVPSVATVKGADLATDSVDDAVPVTVPGIAEATVTPHSPAAFVTHPSGPAGTGPAPFAGERATVTVSPAAGTNDPVPVSFSSRAVKVCGSPARPVPVEAIEILASTHVVSAGSEFARSPSVPRTSALPFTESVECADTSVTPGRGELSVTPQLPVPPETVHGLGEAITPGPESIVNQMPVPSGATCEPAPSQTFTWPVIARDPPTRRAP